ncbi:hypothetical protein Pan44_46750 [Caulifigura coniformis]|uniref:Uncharacterized protein n=1 Tax=Caulifigura coniformis TaxID=2527983 RepID=A0A517SKH8_9PLAN|nr:hypothetical protein [Caulifigura coniformis]QDT56618.1 hypothetical protein Pan44_46750 [Caulifigura coniformis]
MTLILSLPDNLEDQLRARAAAAGQDVEAFVQQVVADSLAQVELKESVVSKLSVDFARRVEAWIGLHPVLDHAVDDSRESIYAGRDE